MAIFKTEKLFSQNIQRNKTRGKVHTENETENETERESEKNNTNKQENSWTKPKFNNNRWTMQWVRQMFVVMHSLCWRMALATHVIFSSRNFSVNESNCLPVFMRFWMSVVDSWLFAGIALKLFEHFCYEFLLQIKRGICSVVYI